MAALTVSVVICAYTEERWPDLQAGLASVRAQTRPADEIIVVVDHNEALLRRLQQDEPAVQAIANAGQPGIMGARDTGIRAARGDVVAFLDDDARAESDWLAQLLPHYADPRVVGVGGAICPIWPARRPAWFPREFDWVVGCSYRGLPERVQPVRNLIGANMSLRRAVLLAVGHFRIGQVGNSLVKCDDTEICIRIRQRWPESLILHEPRALVHHRVTPVRATARYFLARCFGEGRAKALISQLVGASDGLASERAYTLRVLPGGVLAGLGAALRGELSGLGRAAFITIGLLTTALGYAVGRLDQRRGANTVGAAQPQPETSRQ